eukprot:gnl/MRDRNA2_/MRDRNA2_17994_c0_seq1.p2 gnl/MRDRNA2_/MRDRNA2_17994_c0~~gnl/MRDRNA2_/MRDRNA2_17994_c0_seq1.p2  ORF type:complete len:220 (-),score=24.75 gnl/MRDRNA2_/MRDRNA2_17994_c0_seq1:60-719(-)
MPLKGRPSFNPIRFKPELLWGLQSSELPEWRLQGLDPELKIPAALLKAYKAEILNFILRERAELGEILALERKRKRNEDVDKVEVKWEHRVLRRSFDGGLATHSDLRLHRDGPPEDLEKDSGVLCVFTVILVLENHDPVATVWRRSRLQTNSPKMIASSGLAPCSSLTGSLDLEVVKKQQRTSCIGIHDRFQELQQFSIISSTCPAGLMQMTIIGYGIP